MEQVVLTDKVIMNQVENIVTFHRGYMYFSNNKVSDFIYDAGKMAAHAKVLGEHVYDVVVNLTHLGNVQNYSCSCPAFMEYNGACKHVVAVLKAVQSELERIKYTKVNNQKAINQIFDFFSNVNRDVRKQEVNLEIMYNLETEYREEVSSVELKIGQDRLYTTKSLKNFLRSIDKYETIEFGKNFSFDPDIHIFSKQDQAIINLFMGIYENEVMLENSNQYSYYQRTSAFKGKKVYLTNSNLKRLLDMLKDKAFNATIFGEKVLNINIVEQDIELEFDLKQRNDDMLLALTTEQMPIPITKGGDYFYYEGRIFKPSEEQKKYFLPVCSSFLNNPRREIVFPANQKGRFVSEVLPFMRKVAEVKIDSTLEEAFYYEELQTKLYFDKAPTGIKGKLDFEYGDELINPFAAASKDKLSMSSKILVRDIEKERRVLDLLENAEFIVNKGEILLVEEEKIFSFVLNILPQLQELVEVYYSEGFKSLQVRSSSSVSGKIRLNEDSSLLEFSFQYEDIDNAELEHILSSLKEKKKYHRLKDGSFIPLNAPELNSMAELINNLDLSAKDIKNKVIELPKFRAMYIDSYIRNSDLKHIERNKAFKQLVQNVCEPQDMEFEVPEQLQNVLRDYQKTGFKWLKTLSAYGLGGILADDMGLGKTLQVITFILSEKAKSLGPSLVVAPTSLVYNWQDEVRKFAPMLNVLVISGAQKERQEQITELKNADIVVTSYPLLRRDIEMYDDVEFDYFFLDEAQHIKNPNTLSAKSVSQIKAKGCFALTGTPVENSLTELWSIFNAAMPGYLLTHNKFTKKYESPIVKGQDPKAVNELSRHIKPFILRRMKRDVLKELPQKIETRVTAEMTDEQKKVYLAYLQRAKGDIARDLADDGFQKSHIKILAALTRLRQICCHPSLFLDDFKSESGKMLLLQEIIEDALESGHRILLFSQFTSMLDIIGEYLDKEKIEYFYLQGSTKTELRGEMVRTFNEGKGKIFLISLKAGGTGLNLTGADMVIHYDPWWNPAVEDQATDRAYRIGQKNVVQVMKLITQGTIEEKIYNLQQKKKEIIDAVIQPGETFVSKLTEQEVRELFEM